MPETLNQNSNELMKRENDYNLSILVYKKLLEKGLLMQEEYERIDIILREKYRPILTVFIDENP